MFTTHLPKLIFLILINKYLICIDDKIKLWQFSNCYKKDGIKTETCTWTL